MYLHLQGAVTFFIYQFFTIIIINLVLEGELLKDDIGKSTSSADE